jgi:hypothetical protein
MAMTRRTANLWHNFITVSFHVFQEYIFLIAHRYLEILKVNINFDIISHIFYQIILSTILLFTFTDIHSFEMNYSS